jgi:hypothetical protein
MALAGNRNFVDALQGLGWCKLLIGPIDEVIPFLERDRALHSGHLDPRRRKAGREIRHGGGLRILDALCGEGLEVTFRE